MHSRGSKSQMPKGLSFSPKIYQFCLIQINKTECMVVGKKPDIPVCQLTIEDNGVKQV